MTQAIESAIVENPIPLLATVALLADVPKYGLVRGQVGAVVEILAPDAVEVEFVDRDGHTYALEALYNHQIVVLQYCAVHQAA